MNHYKLYHYSKELYTDLRTLENKGIVDDKEGVKLIEKYYPDKYNRHISFFFNPIPLDIIGNIFKSAQHKVWYSGSKLIEYIIDINAMPEFKYDIVESPLTNKMFYDTDLDHLSDDEFIKLLYSQKIKTGEVGYSKRQFINNIDRFIGLTREYYLLLPTRVNFDKIKNKYAATVPHVMIYPEGGVIKYESFKHVIVK